MDRTTKGKFDYSQIQQRVEEECMQRERLEVQEAIRRELERDQRNTMVTDGDQLAKPSKSTGFACGGDGGDGGDTRQTKKIWSSRGDSMGVLTSVGGDQNVIMSMSMGFHSAYDRIRYQLSLTEERLCIAEEYGETLMHKKTELERTIENDEKHHRRQLTEYEELVEYLNENISELRKRKRRQMKSARRRLPSWKFSWRNGTGTAWC